MATSDVLSPRQFLQQTGARIWRECHYTLAKNQDEAVQWFAARGINGKVYPVPFGWWCVPLTIEYPKEG